MMTVAVRRSATGMMAATMRRTDRGTCLFCLRVTHDRELEGNGSVEGKGWKEKRESKRDEKSESRVKKPQAEA